MEKIVRVLCVVDNAVQRGSLLWGEHGLSFLIEAEDKRVLFDTGQSGKVLLHNLELLDVDPATIDVLSLSHAHNDHSGGLSMILQHVRAGIPLYAHSDLFRERFSRKDGETSNKGFSITREEIESHVDLRLEAGPVEIIPGVWTTGGITERQEPEGRSPDHLMREGDSLIDDAYRDDISLVLRIGDHLMLLCGCCHAGLLNTLAHVERTFNLPIAFIAGGLHLAVNTVNDLQHVGDVLLSMPTLKRIYPNHCTGEAAYGILTQALGPSTVQPCPAGTKLDLDM